MQVVRILDEYSALNCPDSLLLSLTAQCWQFFWKGGWLAKLDLVYATRRLKTALLNSVLLPEPFCSLN
jgi:hypothetical protein